jgi:hypothetical protein
LFVASDAGDGALEDARQDIERRLTLATDRADALASSRIIWVRSRS